MLTILIDIGGAYAIARYIANVWIALLCGVLVGVAAAIAGGLLVYFTASDSFTQREIAAQIVIGLFWHPIIAIIAVLIFRKSTKKRSVIELASGSENDTKQGN
ncbi:hypothetical protein [Elongatibacter sediminis]|uniref:Uncharacterized protein n=1 Tax=Elongatibacter sediminis TaxID=3119006 RepID=A0AAW9RP25_9GAMM